MENSSVIKSSNNKTTSPKMMNSPSQTQVIAMFSAYMVVCGRRGCARKVSFLVTNKALADVMILGAMSLVFLSVGPSYELWNEMEQLSSFMIYLHLFLSDLLICR